MKSVAWLTMILFSVNIASAAILHGTIYDMDFRELNNVIVQVNTSTPQRFVSKEGQYSFVLDPGSYKITSVYELPNHVLLHSEQNITILGNGYYVNDIFLRPTNPISGDVVYEVKGENKSIFSSTIYWWSFPVIIALIAVVIMFLSRNNAYKKLEKKIEEGTGDKYMKDVLKTVRQEGGRTTQKDIRKKIPLSEAKISLLITELESKGIIKKIKKGRGNIITLNR